MAPLHALVDFYRIQLHLLWRWSGGWPAVAWRAALIVLSSLAAFLLTIAIVPELTINDPWGVAATALVLAIVSTVTRPVLIALLSGISVLLVGLATLAIQAVALVATANVSHAISIDGVRGAFVASVVYAVTHTVLAAGLSIANDDAFFGTLVRQLAARHRGTAASGEPGVVFIQIDGLSYPVLVRELERGGMPTLARWLRSDGMVLDEWEPLLPTQTSASQAGILHGTNDGIPAFRWWEKDRRHLYVSNHPADAREVMRRLSDGHGLLVGGTSIGNLFSGDAERSYLTAATVDDPAREARRSHVLDWFFVSPYAYLRWLVLSIGEVVKEILQAQGERLRGIQPRGDRGHPYPLARAATNVILRHLVTSLVIEELYRGAPVIYADLVDYDEIAHHAGIERVEARDALRGVDRIVGLIEKAALDVRRAYRIVVLSDHGQSPGATFRQRHGERLEDVIARLMGGNVSVNAATARAEHAGRFARLVAEAPSIGGSPRRDRSGPGKQPDLVVAASGNLAQVSFPHLEGRATREAIDTRYPDLIDTLARHPGVGLLLVRSAADGPLVIGADRVTRLEAAAELIDRYGPHARDGLRRVDAMSNCGDIVVLSEFDPGSGEVAAFEDQIGSHGGLGGWQSSALILHPKEWSLGGRIVGAPELHRAIRAWLVR